MLLQRFLGTFISTLGGVLVGVLNVIGAPHNGLYIVKTFTLGLILPLGLAGFVYDLLGNKGYIGKLKRNGILFWMVAFPLARLIGEIILDGYSFAPSNARSNGLTIMTFLDFFFFQALIGAVYGAGFVMAFSQLSGKRLAPR